LLGMSKVFENVVNVCEVMREKFYELKIN